LKPSKSTFSSLTRRNFLAEAAVAVAAVHPITRALAQPASSARYKRYDLHSPQGQAMLKGYAVAVEAMLALPPTHPHNWYRNAIVHMIDCPHGNWWFLPWHRGFTGCFEQTVRHYSGNPEFAFPYWDWTAHPYAPAAFFSGFLDPSHPKFIRSFEDFQSEFEGAIKQYYAGMTPAQHTQVELRGYPDAATLLATIKGTGPKDTFFPDVANARRKFDANRSLGTEAFFAVSTPVMECAFEAITFEEFGSYRSPNHYKVQAFGAFEGYSHNLLHNDFQGFLQDMFLPVDPIFMVHHCNIDRLWSRWTRQQIAAGRHPLPTSGLDVWKAEPFVFFIGADGKSVAKQQAGDYYDEDQFEYEFVEAAPRSKAMLMNVQPSPFSGQKFSSTGQAAPTDSRGTAFSVSLPAPLLRAAAGPPRGLVAEITVEGAPHQHGEKLNVFLNPPAGALDATSASYLGSVEFFGVHHHSSMGSVVFTLPFCDALRRRLCEKSNTCKDNAPLEILVTAPQPKLLQAMSGMNAVEFKATAVSVRAL
jgi:tyrosinase